MRAVDDDPVRLHLTSVNWIKVRFGRDFVLFYFGSQSADLDFIRTVQRSRSFAPSIMLVSKP
jgi:hypothetical protein